MFKSYRIRNKTRPKKYYSYKTLILFACSPRIHLSAFHKTFKDVLHVLQEIWIEAVQILTKPLRESVKTIFKLKYLEEINENIYINLFSRWLW